MKSVNKKYLVSFASELFKNNSFIFKMLDSNLDITFKTFLSKEISFLNFIDVLINKYNSL